MVSQGEGSLLAVSGRRRLLALALVLGLVLAALWLTGPLAANAGATQSDAQAPLTEPGPNLRSSHKVASRYVVGTGEVLSYTIRLRNTGDAEATAQVTDTLPEEVTYNLGSAAPVAVYDQDAGSLSWTDIQVPAAGEVSLTFEVTTKDVATPTAVLNTVEISADGDTFERSAAVLLVPEGPGPGSNLHRSHKTASRPLVAPGDTLSYTIRLRNQGETEAIVQVTDPLPPEVTYVPGSATPAATYEAGTLSWADISVPARGEAPLTFAVTAGEVDSATIIDNAATIRTNGDSFERRAWVLLVPEHPELGPRLWASHKTASQHRLGPGETVSYTIRLHNSGTSEAVAQVTDELPPEVTYVPGSASPEATYDQEAGTLTWADLSVPVEGDVWLSFAATAKEVDRPTVATNVATITSGDDSFERHAWVVLLPEPPADDVIPPVVHSLTIDDQDVLDTPEATLHISATDDVELRWMYFKEWEWTGEPAPHWALVQSSGWIPYQADYPWTLGSHDGVHYVGVWVGDGEYNRSHVHGLGLDFANLVQPGATVPPLGVVPYLVYYEAGVDVSASLSSVEGDVKLYAWDTHALSQPIATDADAVSLTTERAGTYLFIVRGEPDATYDLTLEPAGGPRPPVRTRPGPHREGQGLQLGASLANQSGSGVAEDLIAMFAQSGLDPLEAAEAPGAPGTVYLPIAVR